MADQYGLDRTASLPRIPLDAAFTPELLEYLRQLHESLYAMYDDLSRRQNEFLTERQWIATTLPEFTADQDNLDTGVGIAYRFSTDASRNITGILNIAKTDGLVKVFFNVGGFDGVFQHQNAGSDAQNRIIAIGGADVTVASNGRFGVWFDQISERWRQWL